MSDRNTQPYSEEFYREIEEEVRKIVKEKSPDFSIDVNLIRIHLNSIEQAIKLYKEQIEIVLERIETISKNKESS